MFVVVFACVRYVLAEIHQGLRGQHNDLLVENWQKALETFILIVLSK